MRLLIVAAFILAAATTAQAQMPKLKTLHVSWDAYTPPSGTSNCVIVLYKQTSLGSVFSPMKPTAYFPATRTNATVAVLAPGTYRFQATAQGEPLPESLPSNVVTLTVAP